MSALDVAAGSLVSQLCLFEGSSDTEILPSAKPLLRIAGVPRMANQTSTNGQIKVKRDGGKIWSHIRQKWLNETPEERVRQEYLLVLVNAYGFSIEQIGEELEVTGRGAGQARADFAVWKSLQDKLESRNPLIVVECKSDNVTIQAKDYHQGDHYARLANAPFFVTHNSRETRFWRVLKDRLPGFIEEIENIPHAAASNKEIEELIAKLKVFKENEFADLLHTCHSVIRNRDHKDPAEAFDEIAKIMFVKVWVERELKAHRRRVNIFSVALLKEQIDPDPLNGMFDRTKTAYQKDQIFADDANIDLKPTTSEEIVRLLERYNLSETSEDIKGIAFERFLGKTFRGEIGQYFTPRCIVEFMIRMVEPKEGDTICDPASGSGGFLIRFFEIVREQIMADVDRQYQELRMKLDAKGVSEAKKAKLLRDKYDGLQESINQALKGSRTWTLANACIFGTDANERMARTSKMNMIMHGDGHGNIHHHNGFIDVNGIFERRFTIVLTNPPFGAFVEPSDVVTEDQVSIGEDEDEKHARAFGAPYKDARSRTLAVQGKPITTLYELPREAGAKIRTEVLFIERCLRLLVPGGRLGIVLPEGVFNNPSPSYVRVREFCEDRGFIRAVISMPQEAFFSSGTTVKTSLLFMQKFTEEEQTRYDMTRQAANDDVDEAHREEMAAQIGRLELEIEEAREARNAERRKDAEKELRAYRSRMETLKKAEARLLLKQRFSYFVFMYEAEKVGITATGEDDENELHPNRRVPKGVAVTCLEHYLEFQKNPEKYLLEGAQ